MTTFKKQMFSVLATGTMLLNVATPAFAATTIEISGNGSHSDNTAKVEVSTNTTVVQSNDAKVTNNVSSNSSTGGNQANDNTGGKVDIETGDAKSDVKVENTLNSNSATVDCCEVGDTEVTIKGNGTKSENEVELEQKNSHEVYQDNEADVKNNVDANAKTGGNEADDNTGGDVEVNTGDAESSVAVSTTANANWATIGGGDSEGGSLSLRIMDNGSHTENEIDLEVDNDNVIVQDNDAKVRNNVDANAYTGDNEVEDSTGGDVVIETGDATADVSVDNMVNFNWADLDCGCLSDLLAKVVGNGTDSENKIKAELGGDQEVYQGGKDGGGNDAHLYNDADADAKTGYNDAEDNTGDSESDPSIETGDADSMVEVSNSGNSNVFGDESPSDWPEFDFNFNISMSLAQLMALLGN